MWSQQKRKGIPWGIPREEIENLFSIEFLFVPIIYSVVRMHILINGKENYVRIKENK